MSVFLPYVNNVTMIGRAAAEPRVNVTGKSKVATFRVCCNKYFKGRDGEKQKLTTFVDVDVWGKRADYAESYISKGTPVYVVGELQMDTWEKDGVERSKLKIYGNHIQAFKTDEEAAEATNSKSKSDSGDYEDPPF